MPLKGTELINLGYGDPLIGFCPYLRHAHGSDDKLSAVT